MGGSRWTRTLRCRSARTRSACSGLKSPARLSATCGGAPNAAANSGASKKSANCSEPCPRKNSTTPDVREGHLEELRVPQGGLHEHAPGLTRWSGPGGRSEERRVGRERSSREQSNH